MPPEAFERIFRQPFEVLEVEPIKRGRYGAKRLTVESPAAREPVRIKWALARRSLDLINNSPRKEIAAYQIQRLVLDPDDYVIPTTALVCLPVDDLPGVARANVEDSNCSIGAVAAWLDGLRRPGKKVDEHRFVAEPTYAYHAANLNLVTVLIDHSDSHKNNLLEAEDEGERRIYSIDNGVSFGSWFRNPTIWDWNRVRVPALRRASIERLRALEREDLDSLGVVAQLERRQDDLYHVAPASANLGPEVGVRRSGSVIQIGLTRSEIDGIWHRREKLLAGVDDGLIATF